MDHTGIVGVVKNHVDPSEDHQTLYWFKGEKKNTKKKCFRLFLFCFSPYGVVFLSIFSFLSFSNGRISLYDLKYEMLLS